MKDFAKSVRTNNVTIDPKDDTLRKLEDELRGWLKTYDSKDPNVDKANVEKNIREIRAEIEKYKRKHNIWNTNAGNAKVGNLDPRISSIKSKLQNLAKQGDEGGIKDVEKFVEEMIKEINKRKDDLYAEINRAEENRQGWLDLRGDVMSARYEATHMKK